MQTFSTRNVNNVTIGWRDGDGADGLSALTIEDRVPCAAVVSGFPDATVCLAHIEDIGLIGDTGCCTRAPATKGSDHPPTHLRHRRRVFRGKASSREKRCGH